ncbi:hypothetical protein LHFGNBLO_003254 [Mesorhizobium sp. AR10]|uniref:hypothetical protein n=1 Tax=Mesorhizobium sp. AR10 TaxID=2865839 RepID=UPI00215DEC54|nr:hypothetical protein [Mesorhizobium sp. AR10]UVK36344.1 hypothetical protein LHFGNBLO_003254 [Mesorhizobium sp. AR10]
MRKLALVFGGLIVLVGLWAKLTESGQILTGGWSSTEGARVDRGTYFRLKVDLTYRGEPQHFDIVVGCNVLDIDYKDGSNTREVGLVPTVYGRRMSDGKGLVIRAPDACDGRTTADGRVPPDFMPVMIVYDKADRLDFGTAYISDEAYESPLSLMTFGTASVEKATRAAFVEFRKNGPPNLVTREQYHSFQSDQILQQMGLRRVWPSFARTCWAQQRYRVPDEIKSELAKFQPEGGPRYWGPSSAERERDILSLMRGLPRQRDDGGEARSYDEYVFQEMLADRGVPNRMGGGTIGTKRYPPSFYPVASAISADKWPSKPQENSSLPIADGSVIVSAVDVDGGRHRGFAYCYDPPLRSMYKKNLDYLDSKALLIHDVDDIPIANLPRVWKVPVTSFVENLDFLFLHFEFWIDSMRGDV